jgi:predicted DCC family thiol-disulfide oxidoreductase YuxK
MKFLTTLRLVGMSVCVNSVSKLSHSRELVWTNIVLYDGMCNFCTSCANLVRKYDKDKKFTLAPLQSPEGKAIMRSINRSSDDLSSVVYVRRKVTSEDREGNEVVFDKSDAAIHVCEELLGVPSVLVNAICNIIPKSFRDSVYDLVAKNRYRIMGKKEDCGCSTPAGTGQVMTDTGS